MASSRKIFGICYGTIIWIRRHFISSHDGEYIIYYRGKIVGGIIDRLLVKPVKAAIDYAGSSLWVPYEGAKGNAAGG